MGRPNRLLSQHLLVVAFVVAACSTDDTASMPDGVGGSAGAGGSGGSSAGGGGPGGEGGGSSFSPGCEKAPLHSAGGISVTIDAGPGGDGTRTFFLSLPSGYDPSTPHRLIVGYAGTNWTGEQIQPYLQLEDGGLADEIFVYPDPLWRDFPGWGNLGGWLLGPNASPANGDQDLVFTAAILDYMEQNYCIDTDRVFATGHSWGGDMAMVVSCFMGDRFAGSVPVAANEPYWFEKSDGTEEACVGNTAVWTMFGQGDDHFSWQSYPGEFGDLCRDFWMTSRSCSGTSSFIDLGLGAANECVEYQGCSAPVRYCLYGAQFGHQIPDYFPASTMAFFRSL